MIDRIELGEPSYRIHSFGGKDDGSRHSGGNPNRFKEMLKEREQRRGKPSPGDTENGVLYRERTDKSVPVRMQVEHLHTRVTDREREEGVRHIDILVS